MKPVVFLSYLAVATSTATATAQPAVTDQKSAPGQLQPAPVVDHGHHAWTFGVGVGGGSVANKNTSLGAATVHVFFGGWISPRTAITFDTFSHVFSTSDTSRVYTIYGVGMQHFVGPKFWLGGSLGAAGVVSDDSPVDSHESKIPRCCDTTLGLTARAGYNLSESGVHAFTVSADLSAGAFDPTNVFSFSLNLGYQVL